MKKILTSLVSATMLLSMNATLAHAQNISLGANVNADTTSPSGYTVTFNYDTSDDTKSVYLLDNKDMKYYFYSNEIIENKLMVESKFTRNLQIKFSNSYSSDRKINKLVFSKFVLNYDEYKTLENKEEYNNFYEYRVNV